MSVQMTEVAAGHAERAFATWLHDYATAMESGSSEAVLETLDENCWWR